MKNEIRMQVLISEASWAQGQDEFHFSLPYDKMDFCLYGKNNSILVETVADAIELTPEQVQRIYNDTDTRPLQNAPFCPISVPAL